MQRPYWRNWAGNQQCRPASVEAPRTEEELAAAIRSAADRGQRVKAVGAGHSFTGAALTSGVLLDLAGYCGIIAIDAGRQQVTVQAGMRLAALNDALAGIGLALPNLGDIAYQSVAGAIATGTHGTGARLGGLATQVVGMRLLDGNGAVVECSTAHEPEVLQAARVGVGALGLVSTVTLQCVPSFDLHALEAPMHIDEVVADLDTHVAENDHFEFFWVPHTPWALTKRNNRTSAAPAPRSAWRAFRDDILYSNVAFGALCRVGRLRPTAIPAIMRRVPTGEPADYVDRSDRIFASPRFVRFVEMEYEIPRPAVREALDRVRALVDDAGLTLSFPVEVRFTAADDIPLSTASGRESAYIAVHVYRGMPYQQYFEGVEAIMDDYAGRPHWGKVHFQTASTLAPRYPLWDLFQDVRARLDPDGRFANAYTERVLGPITKTSGATP